MNEENNIRIFKPTDKESIKNIFIEDGISAGFPSLLVILSNQELVLKKL